jgi:DNA-binding NarL/FixJ family response regulator
MRRVFLADHHQPVRSALRLLLEHEPDLAVVGEADEVGQVIAAVGLTHPDLILLDWGFVERAGRGLVATLRQSGLARVIAMSCRPEDWAAAEDAGADAFVCMGEPPERLLTTVRAVLAGLARLSSCPSAEERVD